MSDGKERNIPENSIGLDEECHEVDGDQSDACRSSDVWGLLTPLLVPSKQNIVSLLDAAISLLLISWKNTLTSASVLAAAKALMSGVVPLLAESQP